MGSGKYIKRAILKYGPENFTKEYLGIYDAEWKMNLAEKILVVIDEEVSYNLCPGGKGGWGYINENGIPKGKGNFNFGSDVRELTKQRWEENKEEMLFHLNKNRNPRPFLGKKHSEETKAKMSASHNPKSHPIGVKRGPYKKRIKNTYVLELACGSYQEMS